MAIKRPASNAEMCSDNALNNRLAKILVVDDIQDNLDLIVELFEGDPWNVKTADNAMEAWTIIKRWNPDLVLLDIRMPDFNGHHLCAAIRKRHELDDLPVIFMTAEHTDEDEIERGLKMGADDYICKPIEEAALRERVRSLVDRFGERRAGTRG